MEDHDEEIPNHHLPRMSDLDNPSGHHNHPHFSQMPPDMDNHPANDYAPPPDHHRPNSGKSRRQYRSPTPPPGPPPHHHNHHGGKPMHFPSPLPPPAMGYPHQGKPHHSHSPQVTAGRRRQSSKAGPFAAIATLLLLAGLTALILFLVYRPKTPHFTVVATTIYLLNSTSSTTATPFGAPPTASYLATSIQFTVVTRNPHHRTSIYYDHLTTQVFYRDQAITPPSDLPPLCHRERSTVVFSPVLGGGAPMPVAPGVVEGLAADEAYGMLWLRLAINGRVRFKAGNGFIKSAHYGVYVGCDILLGVKKAVVGPVPLLANHDCKVDW